MQIANSAFEIEVGEDDRSHHAAIEISGYELRHAVRIDGLEQSLLYPLTDDPREQLPLLIVKPLDRVRDV